MGRTAAARALPTRKKFAELLFHALRWIEEIACKVGKPCSAGRSGGTPTVVRRQGNANPRKPEKGRPVSEGTQGQQGNENYSLSDSNSTTVENDKSPKGPLATLLDLDILPSLVSDTTALESGEGEGYSGQG
jgi:hypothetical protein